MCVLDVPNAGEGLKRLDYRQEWDRDFREYLKKLDAQKPLILCGDLNVAHNEIGTERERRERGEREEGEGGDNNISEQANCHMDSVLDAVEAFPSHFHRELITPFREKNLRERGEKREREKREG